MIGSRWRKLLACLKYVLPFITPTKCPFHSLPETKYKMDQDRIVEITPEQGSSAAAEKVQKLLKDVLDRYLKSQVELVEILVELFQRHENLVAELEDGTKRKRGN